MRTRIVTENTQILASHVKEINSLNSYNMKIVNDGIIGISKGVVSGLDIDSIANTSTTFTFPSGIVCDGEGTFYELLTNTLFTMSGGAGTYKAYVQYCQVTDLPVTSWTLVDVNTRTETFIPINTRTYDALTGNVTTGTVPTNAEQVATIVWDGAAIISITDARSFVTIGSLPAYTLQGFTTTIGSDVAFRTGKLTGNVIDETDTSAVRLWKVNIDNTHAGVGFDVDTGNNTNALGYLASTSGNVGYKVISQDSSTGFVSTSINVEGMGFTAHNHEIGFKSNVCNSGFVANGASNLGIGFAANGLQSAITSYNCSNILNSTINSNQFGLILQLSNQSTGFIMNGINSNDKGIFLNNISSPFEINNYNQTTNNVAHKIIVSGNVLNNFGSLIQVLGAGIGLTVTHENGLTTTTKYGIYLSNNSTSTTDRAIIIDGVTTNYAMGIQISNANSGIVITTEAGKTGLQGFGVDSTDNGIKLQNFSKGIVIDDGTNGIEIGNTTGVSATAFRASNSKFGLVLHNNNTHHALFEPFASDPVDGVDGELAVVTVAGVNKLKIYTGSAWVVVGTQT